MRHHLRNLGLTVLLPFVAVACSTAPTERPPEVPGWAAATLDAPESIVLLALDPLYLSVPDEEEGPPGFHGYPVLGEAFLDDPGARARLRDLVFGGIAASNGTVAGCFDPRHGIRATRDGVVTEWVICFSCLSMRVHAEGQETAGILTSRDVEPAVSALYRSVGLEIAD